MANIELTHFERVMKQTSAYDQEGRTFAQRAVSGGNPLGAFRDFVSRSRKAIPPTVSSPEEFVRLLMPLSSRALNYTHHLTQEMLRRQENKNSFTELTKNDSLGRILSEGLLTSDAQVLNSSGHMHYHMAVHRMAGRKVYDVSAGLAEKLRNTELRGLTADDLRLPFPSIYIMAPKEAELEIYNVESNWHRVVGIYLSEDVDGEGYRCWRFLVCGEPKPRVVMPGVEDDNDALIYFHVPLPEKMALTDAVAKAQEECIKDVEELKKAHVDGFGPMLEKWQEIFRWAMNVVLYTSIEGAESEELVANEEARRIVEQMRSMPKGSKKRHKLGGRLSQMQQCQRIVLGRSVTVQRGGWSLTVRVLVSGHWRNQPFGPGRMYRRLQWIEPFWRGPDGAEVATTTPEVASVASGTGGAENEPRNGKSDHAPSGAGTAPAHQGAEGPDRGDEGDAQAKASNA